jgi:hypothetical protein
MIRGTNAQRGWGAFSAFSTAIAALALQYPAGGVQFQRIGADKGDSGLKRLPIPEWLLPRDNAQVYPADCEAYQMTTRECEALTTRFSG